MGLQRIWQDWATELNWTDMSGEQTQVLFDDEQTCSVTKSCFSSLLFLWPFNAVLGNFILSCNFWILGSVFHAFFFFLIQMKDFYWSIFKVIGSLLSCVHPAAKPVEVIPWFSLKLPSFLQTFYTRACTLPTFSNKSISWLMVSFLRKIFWVDCLKEKKWQMMKCLRCPCISIRCIFEKHFEWKRKNDRIKYVDNVGVLKDR